MKYTGLLILMICLVALSISSCEKDDICAQETPTTPRLIIQFYDIANTDELKIVPDLLPYALDDMDNIVPIVGATLTSTDSILVPLRTAGTSTRIVLHQNFAVNDNGTPEDPSDDTFDGNPDVISVTYDTEDVYVSRACGFKTVFNNVAIVLESDTDNWIASIDLQTTSITNETITHVKIFH